MPFQAQHDINLHLTKIGQITKYCLILASFNSCKTLKIGVFTRYEVWYMCDTFSVCISEQKHCMIIIKNTLCDNIGDCPAPSQDIETGSGC